ncbi:hypothetical protein [Arthrobacter sp. B3I4]|uniref:hypothetical protein n=1 Tax=Arthrobacter sp. B3I4 TaxID=3042267 RepID=UPI00278240A0|nr:hypothetical protein [Arthrobacter sp. B3I4]MDQ0756605.1 hypothetical protein [Arthrobacter sp. B3I4]
MNQGKLLALACLTLALQAGPALTAAAQPEDPARHGPAVGNDVSWPQCDGELPDPLGFAVIGVNGGRPETTNPCLAAQLTWAGGTAAAMAGTPVPVYVNTANPGPDGSGWWPASNSYGGKDITNPYGMCDGASTAACAYLYGYAMAFDDVNSRGVPEPAHRVWWLDVETENSWSSDTAANTADLEGMTAYLHSIGAEVGLYSTAYQFAVIAGDVGPASILSTLKEWIPGADSTASALAACADPPLAPGASVVLVQYVEADLDYNVACPAPAPPLKPAGTSTAPATVPPKVVLPAQSLPPGRTPRNVN